MGPLWPKLVLRKSAGDWETDTNTVPACVGWAAMAVTFKLGRPLDIDCQVTAPSVLTNGPRLVAAYNVVEDWASTATAVMACAWLVAGSGSPALAVEVQVEPASVLLKMPPGVAA